MILYISTSETAPCQSTIDLNPARRGQQQAAKPAYLDMVECRPATIPTPSATLFYPAPPIPS